MKLDNLRLSDEIGGKFIVENDSPLPIDVLTREFNHSIRNQTKILDMVQKQQDFISRNAERIENLYHYLDDCMRAIEDLEFLHFDQIYDQFGERLSDNEDYSPAD